MRYFKESELGSFTQYHPGFLQHLDDLRHQLGRSMFITSPARSEKHNKEIGGKPNSFHIWDFPKHPGQKGCLAVDVAVPDRKFKVELVKIALLLGWSVGINDKKRFLHLDRRVDIGLEQTIFPY